MVVIIVVSEVTLCSLLAQVTLCVTVCAVAWADFFRAQYIVRGVPGSTPVHIVGYEVCEAGVLYTGRCSICNGGDSIPFYSLESG